MKRTLIAAIFIALVAAACGGDADSADTTTSTTTSTTSPSSEPTLLLTIADEGGFAPIEFVINRPLTYVLLTDGTLIFQGPQVGAFPGPVMPSLQRTTLTADQLDDIRTLIEAAGLPDIVDEVNNQATSVVADATTTVATYVDDAGATHRLSVYALGIDPNPSDQLANLTLLRETLANFTFVDGAPFTSDRVVVRILTGGGIDGFDDSRPWPFSFEPGPASNDFSNVPCEVLDGAAAEEVKELLSDATQATLWEHENGLFRVLARELTPGEDGCPAL